ncbi:MAG: ferritin [Bacilli bacterium]
MMNKEIQEMWNRVIAIEAFSTQLYVAMAAYAQTHDYPGSAHWLYLQAEEEHNHFLKVVRYVAGRGGVVKLYAVSEIPDSFGDLHEMFQAVYQHEREVARAYEEAYRIAIAQNDPRSIPFILTFLEEQNEEVEQARAIANQFERVKEDPAGVLIVDEKLSKR